MQISTERNMLVLGLRGSAVIGLTAMVMLPSEPQFYVLCATLVTAVSGIVAQVLRDRATDHKAARDAAMEADRRAFELRRTEAFRAMLSTNVITTRAKADELHDELTKNTKLVEQGIEETQQFAVAANNVSSKIASLANAAGFPPALVAKIDKTTTDTNKVVHGLEEKL